ncbi:MAG: hypothetical protein NZT92_20315, partial [Abditibacteriales bacterium]|nr:hypothetical protein [Abditibacteriales bacterium]
MLRRFRVDNFKSLINFTYEPTQVNLIVELNNSGKTNLCQAMRFLSLSSSLPLSQAAVLATGEAWNLPNSYFAKPTIEFECTCDLPFEGNTLRFEYALVIDTQLTTIAGSIVRRFAVSSELLQVTGGEFTSVVLLENKNGQARVLREQRFLSNSSGVGQVDDLSHSYMELPAPEDSTLLSRIYNADFLRRVNLFKNYLLSWRYYDLEAMQLRRTDAQPLELTLRPDGSNLISVLFNLNNLNQRLYRQVIEVV